VTYIGFKQGDDLARFYAAADVFVFPSKTDTFGVVMLEAIASGTPVAAYPVTGPRDVVVNGVNGFTHDDLAYATEQALNCNRRKVRKDSERYDWAECTQTFLDNLTVIS
jgi:glycosyltransferase involved in cell wall biosynthesis